jgi:hypothetical protein
MCVNSDESRNRSDHFKHSPRGVQQVDSDGWLTVCASRQEPVHIVDAAAGQHVPRNAPVSRITEWLRRHAQNDVILQQADEPFNVRGVPGVEKVAHEQIVTPSLRGGVRNDHAC